MLYFNKQYIQFVFSLNLHFEDTLLNLARFLRNVPNISKGSIFVLANCPLKRDYSCW